MRTRTNVIISCLVAVAIVIIFLLRGAPRSQPPPLGFERVPQEESAAIAAVARALANTPPERASSAHCVAATFTVVDNLDPALAIGVLQPGRQYPAHVSMPTAFAPATDPVRVGPADIKQHALGKLTHHFARFQVDHKQRLFPFDFTRIAALLLDPGKNVPFVVPKRDDQADQFVGAFDVLDTFDGADPDICFLKIVKRYGRFNRCWFHFVVSNYLLAFSHHAGAGRHPEVGPLEDLNSGPSPE